LDKGEEQLEGGRWGFDLKPQEPEKFDVGIVVAIDLMGQGGVD
jgi:hypothetical protein